MTIVLPPAARIEPHTVSVRKAVEGLIEGATRTFPGVRVNGVVPSRDPVGDPYDLPLVRAALGLGSMVSEGIRGWSSRSSSPSPLGV